VTSEGARSQQDAGASGDPASAVEMLPAYVLGVLDDDEVLVVEAALATSPDLRAELQRVLEAADALAFSVPVKNPPAHLRDRILQSANTGAALPVSIDSRRRRPYRAVAAIAAMLVLMLAGVVAVLIGEVRERDDEISGLQAMLSRPGTDFTQPLVWSTIDQPVGGPPVRGYFCRTEDGSVGWIIVEGMHMDANHVFQLWLVDGDRVVDGGMFATDAAGRGFGVVRVGVPVHTFSQIWITIEPPGGSPAPTNDPDLKAPII
jgi:anti-sigma-K factor RskA